jgi:Family of unknown function (DUF5718)
VAARYAHLTPLAFALFRARLGNTTNHHLRITIFESPSSKEHPLSFEHAIGLGVAGNFTGHLEQAGEAQDFKDLTIEDPRAPRGVFPFYVPGTGDHFLNVYPISATRVRLGSVDERHQIEPEISILCDLEYRGGRVSKISPREAMAHNDCSIRREGAKKISEKKNWGPESKGTSDQPISIDRFSPGGVLDDYRIVCFLLRDGELFEYGVDSAASSYSYMYDELLEWLVTKLNDQVDEGPLENISDWIGIAGHPNQALISIGATRYTEFGETNFLARGDQSIVAVYDGQRFDLASLRRIARGEATVPQSGISLLRQDVV